ncbi:MAG: CotH kinase family protein [Planctomycetaceae bacterium]|nr:CotH kinase family protein [Planctomycetaceae bacterium]
MTNDTDTTDVLAIRPTLTRAWLVALMLLTAMTAMTVMAADPLDVDHRVDVSFASHLPLLVIEPLMAGNDSLEGRATVKLIDSHTVNHPGDLPVATMAAYLRRSALDRDGDAKGRFVVELEGRHLETLLDLPAARRWVLHGSGADKMMLRNFIALSLAAQVLPGGAPQARYVEVLFRQDGNWRYDGLYLLCEDIDTGIWSGGKAERDAAVIVCPAEGEGDAPLDFDVESEGGKGNGGGADAIRHIESLLYSEDPNAYYSAFRLIDEDSFVDTFILNDTFRNYGRSTAYLSMRADGVLALSPMWWFDTALDNGIQVDLRDEDSFVWLSRFMLGYEFVSRMKSRYYHLLRTVLEPNRVRRLVDDIAAFLGPAMERDWQRWSKVYTDDPRYRLQTVEAGNGDILMRQTLSPEQEMIKIKSELGMHSQRMRHNATERQWQRHRFNRSMDSQRNLILALVFMAGFFLLAHYARRGA